MRRMNVVMRTENSPSTASSSQKYECENCRADFPNKTTADRHMLFCKTLADIRRGGGGGSGKMRFLLLPSSFFVPQWCNGVCVRAIRV